MANLLTNPTFGDAGPPIVLTAENPVFASGPSAAPFWNVASSTPGTTSTEVLPGTRPNGAENMLHVCTTGRHDNGVAQEFQPPEGVANVNSSVWARVVRGKVGIGTGNAAATKPEDAQSDSTRLGEWQLLQAPNKEGPPNTFVIYSVSDPLVSDDMQQGACYWGHLSNGAKVANNRSSNSG